MKIFLIALAVAGSVVGVTQFVPGIKDKVPKIPEIKIPHSEKLSSISLPKVKLGGEPDPTPEPQGEVAGISTGEKINTAIASVKNTLGQAANIVLTTPSTQAETIDVSKIAASMAQNVEAIPGKVAQQAKIQYCLQVLADATKSATSTP